MDVLEQSLYDLGLGWNESYDSHLSSGMTSRSYTKQKYRKNPAHILTIITSWTLLLCLPL